MSTFLITGCAGFIGSNLIERLLQLGHTVVGLDNLSTGLSSNLNDFLPNRNFKFINGDIRNLETCQTVCHQCDFVLHHGALGSVPLSISEPALCHDNNVTGTLNMLIAARDAGVKRFVFASSSSIYGDSPTLPKIETLLPSPMSPYAVSKLTGEYYCKIFNDLYGLKTISLRYFNIFGPRQNPNSQYAAVIPKFITAFLNNESPTIYGDGEQTRDFAYIENVITANLNALTAPEHAYGKAYNIGNGDCISLNRLASIIQSETGCSCNIKYAPARAGDIRDSQASIALATDTLKILKRVSLEEGLKHTIKWYHSQR